MDTTNSSRSYIRPSIYNGFKFQNIPIASGMGTSGFVGQFGTVTAMNSIGVTGLNYI